MMRNLFVFVCLGSTIVATACGREDLGVPDTWGVETMQFQRVEVHETTCGEGPLPFFVGWEAIVPNHNPIPGLPHVDLAFDSPIDDGSLGTGSRRLNCEVEPGAAGTWDLDCGDGQTSLWVEGGFDGKVSRDRRGAFLGPTSLRMDLRYQIIECGEFERCEPYTMDCVMDYSTYYESE